MWALSGWSERGLADVHDVIYRKIRVEYDEVIDQPVIQAEDAVKYEETPRGRNYAPPLMYVEMLFHPEYSADVLIL